MILVSMGLGLIILIPYILWKIGSHYAKKQEQRIREEQKKSAEDQFSHYGDTSMTYLIMDELDDQPSRRGWKFEDVPTEPNNYNDGGPEW